MEFESLNIAWTINRVSLFLSQTLWNLNKDEFRIELAIRIHYAFIHFY